MKGMLWSILAVLMGAVVAVMLVAGGEAIGHLIFPPPADVKKLFDDPAALQSLMKDRAALSAVMEKLPPGSLVVVIMAWGVAAFGGSWLAAWYAARHSRVSVGHGIAVGIILLLATLANLMSFTHPIWMWVGGIALVIVGTYLGTTLAAGKIRSGKPVAAGELV